MIKRIITCFLVLVILTTFVLSISAINLHATFGVFSGTVTVDTVKQSASLENIKIDIYSSTLDQQDASLGLKGYAHDYVFSIYTNADGSFSFTKPSYEFLIIIDINSFPCGYGIEKDTYFYKYGESSDTYMLYPISNIIAENNSVYDNCEEVLDLNADGTSISAPYTIGSSDDHLTLFAPSSDSCIVIIDQQNRADSQMTQEPALFSSDIPSYTSKKTYPSTSSYFRIHYESNGSSITPSFITEAYNHLLITYNNLITSKQFLEPSSSAFSNYMDVYITSTYNTAAAMTHIVANNTSYIVVYNISDLSQAPSLTIKGALSHEYFHCIQNKYRYLADDVLWFSESFANWAAITVATKESINPEIVNLYLESTYISIDYPYDGNNVYGRYYGEVLLPLYLDQYCGGYNTIKNILEYLENNEPISNMNLYIMNAISSALSTQNHTFSSFFTDFAVANYTPQTSYNASLSEWNAEPYIVNSYTVNELSISTPQITMGHLSMQYNNFYLPLNGTYTCDFTVNFTSGDAHNAKCKLLLTGRSTGNIIQRTMTQSSNLYTYSLTSSGSSYSKACIMTVNVGSTESLKYRLTVSLQ